MRHVWIIVGLLLATSAGAATLPGDAVKASQEGRWEEALILWQKASNEAPTDPDIVAELGWAEMQTGRMADARRRFQRALRLAPDLLRAQTGLSTLAIRELRHDEALRWARAAVEAHPKSALAQRALGDALKAAAHRSEAETAYRRAVLLDPSDPRNHAGLGDALMLRRKGEDALKAYKEAARLDPANGEYREGAARAAMQAGRNGEAATLFAEAIDIARQPTPDWTRIDTLTLLLLDTLGQATVGLAAGTETRGSVFTANTRALATADALAELSAIRDADALLNPAMTQRGLAYDLLGQASASELAALDGGNGQLTADAVVFREQARRAVVTARAAALPAALPSR